MWVLMLFFWKSTFITEYIHFYDSDSLLTTLATQFRKTTLKNTFLRDYSAYADLSKKQFYKWLRWQRWYLRQHEKYIYHWVRLLPGFQYQMRNNLIIDTLTTLICKATLKIISSLTTLTTLICKTTLKIISSSTTLTTRIWKTKY